MSGSATAQEARRSLEICNACRYCEGYCAVFPAMMLHRMFEPDALGHLANLCHNCKGCYYACQYAPPHEFGVELPKTFALLRVETYEECAWPRPAARVFARNGLLVSLITALVLAVVLLLTMLLQDKETLTGVHRGPGAFYAVIPYGVMVWTAGLSFGFALLAMAIGVARYWREYGGGRVTLADWRTALTDTATLRNLGGQHGCNDVDEGFSNSRRLLHQMMLGGFLLCFASTSIATVMDHAFGWIAPYSWYSLPVLLGTFGGIGLAVGSAGLIWVKVSADPAPAATELYGMDTALLMLLFTVAVTGLALLFLRHTSMMGWLLCIHLGFVLALFLVLPYSKFVHGAYRFAALLRNAREMRMQGRGSGNSKKQTG